MESGVCELSDILDSKKERVNCFKCEYFYITWDKKFPRGCKAMGFKSKDMPFLVVSKSSGMVCQCFKKRER